MAYDDSGLYDNNDSIGYETMLIDEDNHEKYIHYVNSEASVAVIEHEMRRTEATLQELVEENL